MALNDRSKGGGAEMPFLDHLEELRHRLFYCAIAVAVGVAITVAAFMLAPRDLILRFLAGPIMPYLPDGKLSYLGVGHAFQILMDIGFVMSMVIASPVIIYQIWGFISPALYTHEKKIVLPVIFGIIFLFLCGVMLGFFLILPLTVRWFLGIESDVLRPIITAEEFFSFEVYLCVAFGAVFELPIVLMGLTAIGLVTPEFLAKHRRYAAVGSLIAGTFITADPTAMIIIGVPVYGLYELSIILSRSVYRWRQRRESGEDTDNGPRPPRSGPPPSQGQVEFRREPRRLGAPE